MSERKEIALTAQEWLLRRQAEASLRASRRIFVRVMKQRMPDAKKYRAEWDKLFNDWRGL